ncbi:type II toxin-antitoxin system RelE/ParE family toxin [Ciceribacter sp. L1K23]|uniref:type II toxin-antitoxin system RelE/ParE family toxin n=1 Tax=Ciceribacter sp. L1K23 TaxID=2820276 RepID=UPI001B835738|nr:type II toxin-antitoxin system RelE/ParE family toxin [Ciceribacter sp. L1K23]MBR0556370.1 type II toxin-antitoxin system RelE/ParE family toxin [Ciceribacter sp. L1K23]
MKVVLAAPARDYVRAEAAYLRSHNPQAARRFVDDIKRLAHLLGDFPNIGPPRQDHLLPGVFRFVLGAYLVDYEIRDRLIVILAIRHGRQSDPNLPPEPDFDYEG